LIFSSSKREVFSTKLLVTPDHNIPLTVEEGAYLISGIKKKGGREGIREESSRGRGADLN